MEEIWKEIKGYEGLYQVSNLGRVKSLSKVKELYNGGLYNTKDKILTPRISNGYISVSLHKHNKGITKLIHRLVAEAFIPNPEGKPQVNHIDGNKTNNILSNLEWNTRSENIQHAFNTSLKISQKGEVHGAAKLIEQDILIIRSSNLSSKELAITYRVSHSLINKIKSREIWKHI
jgi:hypothetical protein